MKTHLNSISNECLPIPDRKFLVKLQKITTSFQKFLFRSCRKFLETSRNDQIGLSDLKLPPLFRTCWQPCFLNSKSHIGTNHACLK